MFPVIQHLNYTVCLFYSLVTTVVFHCKYIAHLPVCTGIHSFIQIKNNAFRPNRYDCLLHLVKGKSEGITNLIGVTVHYSNITVEQVTDENRLH